jgi:AraC-like DNA-binding protein
MLLSGQHIGELAELRRQMLLKFAMKDLSPVHHIIRLKITRNRQSRQLYLSQSDYIRRILERFSMHSARSATTLLRIFRHDFGPSFCRFPELRFRPIGFSEIPISTRPSPDFRKYDFGPSDFLNFRFWLVLLRISGFSTSARSSAYFRNDDFGPSDFSNF